MKPDLKATIDKAVQNALNPHSIEFDAAQGVVVIGGRRYGNYPNQYAYLTSPAHFSAFVGGIGSGKSHAGCEKALNAALGQVGETKIATPNLGMIVSATYKMLKDSTLRTFLDLAAPHIRNHHKGDQAITLKNGSEVLYRTATDPELLRGANLSWCLLDEAALYDSMVWRIMIGRLREHGQLGYAFISTTPKGRNWVWQEFVAQQRPDYAIFKAKTRDNPYLSTDYVSTLERSYEGEFAAQELEGEFVAFEGLIYSEFRRGIHLRPRETMPKAFKYKIAGVDWGYAHPGVMLVFGVDYDDRLFLIYEEYVTQRRIEEWADTAAWLNQQWGGIDTFYCDPSEPTFIDALRAKSCNATEANNDVLPGIQAVKSRLAIRDDGQPRLVIAEDCLHTAAEFEMYQWATHKDGIRDAPKKTHDHAMDALRYAVMGVQEYGDAASALMFGGMVHDDHIYVGGGQY